MVLAPYLLILSGCVWWSVSRANPRDRDKSGISLLPEDNRLPAGDNELSLHSPVNPVGEFTVKETVKRRRHHHRKQPAFLGDYDVIEVIQVE